MAIFPKAKDFAPVHQTPAGNGVRIVPHDTNAITDGANPVVTRGIYIGGGGHVNAVMAYNSASVKFLSCAPGTVLPVRLSRVLNTSTTATNIIALW